MSNVTPPLVTIGLPTYNRLDGLLNSLNCFVGQTYKNIEIIISDNHSDIDPKSFLEIFLQNDVRIKYFRQEKNIGMMGNCDFIFTKVRGKYFLWGSDDDWWDPNFIKELVFMLEGSPDSSCAISDFQEVLSDGSRAIYRGKKQYYMSMIGMPADRFPDHLHLLKEFTSVDAARRLEKFISQSERDGKANVHRSLARSEDFIGSVKDLYRLELQNCWGFDQLLAFRLLSKGALALNDQLMFKCTIDNVKNYTDDRSHLEYLLGYVKIIKEYLEFKDQEYLIDIINNKFSDKKIKYRTQYRHIFIKIMLIVLLENNKFLKIQRWNKIKKLITRNDHIGILIFAETFLPAYVLKKAHSNIFSNIVFLLFFPFIRFLAIRNGR